MEKDLYALIGFPLSHSFSGKYFAEKFKKENILHAHYELHELQRIEELPKLLANPSLRGFNVTIPYKQAVMTFLTSLDPSAEKVGAVNVVKVLANGKLKGFNSDYFGFKESFLSWFKGELKGKKVAILGTGGASKAVKAAFKDLQVELTEVSRQAQPQQGIISYDDLKQGDLFQSFSIIVNTTPLGMAPKLESCPDLPYEKINSDQYFFDVIYNPRETLMMKKAKDKGAKVMDGLEMLQLQAEKAWEIWQNPVI